MTATPGKPAPPQAKFYADCIAAAAATGAYDREAEMNVLRFTCTGVPAKTFYDGLGAWSAEQQSEIVSGGRTFRANQKPERDLSGLDYCSTDGAGDYRCVVVMNVGEFLSR